MTEYYSKKEEIGQRTTCRDNIKTTINMLIKIDKISILVVFFW